SEEGVTAKMIALRGEICKIAVGTLIADRPPHRTGRARLRHPAPTLDVGGEAYGLPHAFQAVGRAVPARCPGRAVLFRVLLGPRPWLHELLNRLPGLVCDSAPKWDPCQTESNILLLMGKVEP